MEPPSLKLVLVGGPRQGETLEFGPRSKVRIGRIVRGSNLCIKDDGISSKHLLISLESGRWTIQDLDSSNGTSLNSTPLSPLEPCVLSHNDIVKLGETTSILVQLEEMGQASQSRRYPGRGARGVAKVETVVEDPSLELDQASQSRRYPGRGARGAVKIEPVVEAPSLELDEPSQSRRYPRRGARGAANKIEKHNMEENQVEEVESKKPRRGRLRRKGLQELESVVEAVKEVCIGRDDKVNKQEGLEKSESNKKGQESRRKSENLQEMQLEEDLREEAEVGEGVEKAGEELETVNEEAVKEHMKVGVLESECEADVGDGAVEEDAVKGDSTVGDSEKECGEAASIGVEEGSKGKGQSGGGEAKFDWEKGTLEDWFDFMEVYWPQQIIRTTEEMIEEMKKKAERVNAYILEQKRERAVQ